VEIMVFMYFIFYESGMKQIQTKQPGKKALMFVISEASLFPKVEGKN
jgi:hypothetical protein